LEETSLRLQQRQNVAPKDWRKGQQGNSATKPETEDGLHSFFQGMMELAAPRATRTVQDETSNGLRDQDIELKELPNHFTKRGLYYPYRSN
jgi:hypothetical protein